MTKTNFLFLSFFLLLLVISPLLSNLHYWNQNLLAFSFILLLGIPHGAMDNILFLEKSKIHPFLFYTYYLGMIILNALLWFYLPAIAFIVFLLMSSYHFGQAQFSSDLERGRLSSIMYFVWGASVIISFTFFNAEELRTFILSGELTSDIGFLVKSGLINPLFYILNGFTLALLIGFSLFKKISLEKFLIELIVLGSIYVTAYLSNFLIGFALFFIVIHSFKVFQSEFNHFYNKINRQTLIKFIKKLLPLSILSVFGTLLIFGGIHFNVIDLSYPLVLLILISSITLPHVFVMEKFYQNN